MSETTATILQSLIDDEDMTVTLAIAAYSLETPGWAMRYYLNIGAEEEGVGG